MKPKRNIIIAARRADCPSGGGLSAQRNIQPQMLVSVFDAYANDPKYTRVVQIEIVGDRVATIRDETMKDRIVTDEDRRIAARLDTVIADPFFTEIYYDRSK